MRVTHSMYWAMGPEGRSAALAQWLTEHGTIKGGSDPILDEVNLLTLKEIYPRATEDNFFLDTPRLAYFRARCMVPWNGGSFTQNNFLYAPLVGGGYGIGQPFSTAVPNTLSGTIFNPKFYCVMVNEYLEILKVLNTGPLAVGRMIEIDTANAFQTMSVCQALDSLQDGQQASRTDLLNGMAEAINDGFVPSWNGQIYTSYGTQARNGNVGITLNGNVYWMGLNNGAAGPLTYSGLVTAYQRACVGPEQPDLGSINSTGFGYFCERLQPQQRFTQGVQKYTDFGVVQDRDDITGQTGLRFFKAIILKDDYFPTAYPQQSNGTDPNGGTWKTGTISYTVPATNNGNFPTSNATLTVGEVLVFENTRKILFRIADDQEFGYGMTEFIRTANTTKVSSQLKAAANLNYLNPRLHVQCFGING
jgi:hypothetical protein